MFTAARLKLTAWYLLIIMVVSVTFSAVIYQGVTRELERSLRAQQMRMIISRGGFLPQVVTVDSDLIGEVNDRIAVGLFIVNVVILGLSGAAGYFLSGRTLAPIAQMIDEQNRFIADASHELRTPLTALKSSIEVNLRDKKMSVDDARNLMRSNLEDVDSLSKLADGLIRLTAYHRDGKDLPFDRVDLANAGKDAVRRVAAIAKKKSITIEEEINDVEVKGNAQMLTELMVILLDNAIKYSGEKKSIKLKIQKDDGSALIVVSDQGQGINEADLPHLFERFYRSDKSRSTAGYGLGLAIAHEVAERHHGSIKVESKVGKGTNIKVKIPRLR